MKTIRLVTIAMFFAVGIAYGQSSVSETVTFTNTASVSVGFGSNPGTLFYALAHDSANDCFVSGFSIGNGFGAEVVKYTPDGQLLWEKVFAENDSVTGIYAQSVQHQMVYDPSDNSIVVAESIIRPVIVKFDGNDGHEIWRINMSAGALEVWQGYILNLQENNSTATVFFVNSTNGTVAGNFYY